MNNKIFDLFYIEELYNKARDFCKPCANDCNEC